MDGAAWVHLSCTLGHPRPPGRSGCKCLCLGGGWHWPDGWGMGFCRTPAVPRTAPQRQVRPRPWPRGSLHAPWGPLRTGAVETAGVRATSGVCELGKLLDGSWASGLESRAQK